MASVAHQPFVRKSKPFRPPTVCILSEIDARSLVYGGISYRCSSRRHHHMSQAKAESLVKANELQWIGKHKKIATYSKARTWMKVYNRTKNGAVISCGMQLVAGGGAHVSPRSWVRSVAPGPVVILVEGGNLTEMAYGRSEDADLTIDGRATGIVTGGGGYCDSGLS